MKKLFNTIVVMLSSLLIASSVASCLGDSDETETITYSDCAITSFSLGTLNRYITTKKTVADSSGVYQDSIYKITYDASATKFTIDQYKREIYNNDSLPTCTDTTAIICSISTKNGAYVYLRRLPCDSLSENYNYPLTLSQPDTLLYYSSTDSVNFTVNPREFFTLSSDIQNVNKYIVKLNVHKEDSLKMPWPSAENACKYDEIKALNNGVKMLSVKDKVLIFGNADGANKVFSANNTKEDWTETTTNISLPANAYQNTAVCKDKIYTLDTNGNLVSSSDAANWSVTGVTLSTLYGASSINLYGINNEGKLVAINAEDMSVKTDSPAGIVSSLPTDQYTVYTQPMATGMGAETVVIAGLKNGVPTLYAKTEELTGKINNDYEWFNLNTESSKVALPSCTNFSAMSYGSYTIALTDTTLYTSEDKGLTWRTRYFLYAPQTFEEEEIAQGISMTVDSNNTLWIVCPATGRIWHGKLNYMAWKHNLKK